MTLGQLSGRCCRSHQWYTDFCAPSTLVAPRIHDALTLVVQLSVRRRYLFLEPNPGDPLNHEAAEATCCELVCFALNIRDLS